MRTLPSSVQSLLTGGGPFEPINILKVYWSDTPTLYADKTYLDHNVKGKILELSEIEDVKNINESVLDLQFAVTLDDNDDEFKTIITHRDITKVKVELFQWFSEVPFSDAFMIFMGQIASPITYSEGARQITFTVLNKLEDREFGFSAEEGEFAYLPPNMVGQAWPIVFGQVASTPLPQIGEPPSVVIADGFGVVNDAAWDAELNQINSQLALAQTAQRNAFQTGIIEAYRSSQYDRYFELSSFNYLDDPSQARTHREASQQAFAAAEQYAQDALVILAEYNAKLEEREEQEALERTFVRLSGSNVPNGVTLTFRLNDVDITGVVAGGILSMSSQTVNKNINTTKTSFLVTNTPTLGTQATDTNGEKFYWIDAGTKLLIKNFPLSYVVSATQVVVNAVKAKQNGVYVKVPTGYYTVSYPVYTSALTGGTLTPTVVTLTEPLTSKNDDKLGIRWDDDLLYADVVSTVGPNVVDILKWIIDNYTTLTYDATTFNNVRTLVDRYKANFAVLERKNTIQLLREIAYQARCTIWTNDDKFYLRYQPEAPTPVATITLDDVELNSLELFSETNEDLVTKYTAEWRPSLDVEKPFQVIYRYNIEKYGTLEATYDYYIYNNVESVRKSAEYWVIKQANSWKRLRLNVSYEKIALETFDAVTVNLGLPWIVSTPVVGIIERAVLNTTNNTVGLEIWLPVRLGESSKYVFATPKDVVEKYPVRTDLNGRTGNPLQGVKGDLINKGGFIGTGTYIGTNYAPDNFFSHPAGRDEVIADTNDSVRNFSNVWTMLNPTELLTTRPANILKYNDGKRYDVKPYVPIEAPLPSSGFWPATVIEYHSAGVYLCDVYTKGIAQDPVRVYVQQWMYDPDEIDLIPPGSKTGATRIVKTVAGTTSVEYAMFVPVWLDTE